METHRARRFGYRAATGLCGLDVDHLARWLFEW